MMSCRLFFQNAVCRTRKKRELFLTTWIVWIIILTQICVLTGCAAGTGSESGSVSEKESTREESMEREGEDILQVQALKVGKADAIVLFCGGETMVIDCGEEEDGQEVLEYLQGKGVTEIDVLMITHFDQDHVGGADAVMKGMPVHRVILPAYSGSGTEYEDFMAALEKAGAEPENVQEPVRFQLGDSSVLVEPPASYEIPDNDKEYDNNFSLITTVEYCGQRMVFAGDIEKQRIREWLAQGDQKPCAVLKVPHHGVYNKALEDLFRTLQPAYAIICDSKKNPADDRTLELLQQCGAECLQTRNGDISILCSSEGIEVQQ